MNIQPLRDRLVVRRIEEDSQTSGGLYIPDNAKEKPQRGEVVAAGPGRMLDSGVIVGMDVEVGNVVLFGKYAGSVLTLDGEDYLFINESEVLAVVGAE